MGNRITNFLWASDEDPLSSFSNNGSTSDVETNPLDVGFFNRSMSRKRAFVPRSSNEEDKNASKVIKLDTAKYLHQKLFVEGSKSDVTIRAVEHEWHLHRIYLEQCDYFRCLFNGNWIDSTQNCYNLTIEDERITFEGLNTVFASLYQNEINFELKDLGGILAAATLFNLQVCIERCEELILQSINGENVINFLDLSQCYGCLKAKEQCVAFLSRFFWKLAQEDEFLEKLSLDLMIQIFEQKVLCVADAERDLYDAVRKWIFIQDTHKLNRPNQEIQKYFNGRPEREYYKYKQLLQHIRFQHLITTSKSMKILKTDHIIGLDVLNRVVNDQWMVLLNQEKAFLQDEISDDFFYSHCRRVGRFLTEDKNWRWSGLDFGLDLIMNCRFGMISMLRNISTNEPPNVSLSMRRDYKIHFRLLVLNEKGELVVDTGRKRVDLTVNQKQFIVSYPTDLKQFSVHLFYLNHVPLLSSQQYWSNASLKEEDEIEEEKEAITVPASPNLAVPQARME